MAEHRRMRKGVSFTVGTILQLVLIIGVAALAFIALSQIDVIKAWIFGQFTDEMAEAIKCAYYRCTEGCSEAENRVNEKLFDCSAYCSAVPGEFRPNNKICGSNAVYYPVEITLSESPTTYSKEVGGINFECVVPLSAEAFIDLAELWKFMTLLGNPFGGIYLFLTGFKYDVLAVDSSILNIESEVDSCTPATGAPTFDEALSSFSFEAGTTAYIFTQRMETLQTDIKVVTVTGKQTYTVIPQDEDRLVALVNRNWNRIIFEGVGDTSVKPYKTGGDWVIEIFCPSSGLKEEKVFDTEADCKAGHTFCDGSLSIRCFDMLDDSVLFFYVSYGEPEGAKLFVDTEFKGSYIKLSEDSDIPSWADNKISSVQVPEGWELTLYDDTEYGGLSVTIAGNSSYLVHCKDNWWEFGCPTHVSSIRFDNPGCSATVYKEEDYQEESGTISNDVSDLGDISGPCSGSWNDCINSIKVKEGCKATLYSKSGFDQYYITVSGDSSNIHFDNTASSLTFNIPEI